MTESTVSTTSPSTPESQVENPAPQQPTEQTPDAAVNPAVEQAAPPADPSPEEQLAAGVADHAAADAQREAERTTAEQAVTKLLDQAAVAHTKGERDWLAGMIESGRLLSEYVTRRMSAPLFHPRANAVQAAAGRLAECASSTVDAAYVNRLVLVYHAHRLLADAQGLCDTVLGKGKGAKGKPAVPFGHYKDAWSQLVERVNKDTPEEGYVLLQGFESRCVAVFAECVAARMPREGATGKVRELLASYATHQAEQSKAALAAATEREAAERAELQRVSAERATLEEQSKAAQRTGDTSTVNAVAEELMAKQREQIVAQAREEQARKEREEQERQAKVAEEQRQKAQAKLDAKAGAKAAEKLTPKAEPEQGKATAVPGNGTPNLPTLPEPTQAVEEQNAAEVAADAAELLTGCEEPDDAVEALLGLLVDHGELAPRTKRAIKLALQRLKATDSPSPAEVAAATAPAANGQLVGAA
jgi:hypothetical protein